MRVKTKANSTLLLLAAICTVLGSCSSSMKSTEFTNPGFDFAFVERVAVIPFENLSERPSGGPTRDSSFCDGASRFRRG